MLNKELRYEVLSALAEKDVKLFFRAPKLDEDTSFNNINYIYYKEYNLILSEEFVDEIDKLTFAEAISIISNPNTKNIKRIKNWMAFIGIITIIGLSTALVLFGLPLL